MKAKDIPTSPKFKKDQEIEKLYQDQGLTGLAKPSGRPRANIILVVILSLFFGILGGIFGEFVLFSAPINLPILNKLYIGRSNSNQNPIILTSSRQTQLEKKAAEVGQTIQPSLVGIFLAKKDQAIPLDNIYLEGEQKGQGIVVSSDGWILTLKGVVSDFKESYSVATYDRKVYKVEKILSDSSSDFIFLKISAKGLTAVKLASRDKLKLGGEVLIPTLVASDLKLTTAYLASLNYEEAKTKNDLLKSSEKYFKYLALAENFDVSYQGAPVVNLDDEVVGLTIVNSADQTLILPVDYIKEKLSEVFKDEAVTRSYLGLNYLNLGSSLNIPSKFAQGLNEGALIYGDTTLNVLSIAKNSPAKDKIVENDIILKINEIDLDSNHNLTEVVQSFKPGDELEISLSRNKQLKKFRIILAEQ